MLEYKDVLLLLLEQFNNTPWDDKQTDRGTRRMGFIQVDDGIWYGVARRTSEKTFRMSVRFVPKREGGDRFEFCPVPAPEGRH